MVVNDDRVKDFLAESLENLDLLERDLVSLESDPTSKDLLGNVFRVFHTIKGTCGFFGFSKLEGLTHAAEEVLSKLREGKLSLDARISSTLLEVVDAVRKILATIEATRTDGEDGHAVLIRRLSGLLEEEPRATDRTVAPASPEAAAAASPSVGEANIRVDVTILDKLMNLVGELVLTRNQLLQLSQTQKDRPLVSTSKRLDFITTRLQEEVMRTRLQRISVVWDRFPRIVRDLALTCGKQVRLELDGEGTELDKSIIEAIRDPLTHMLRNSIDHGIETPAARTAQGKPAEGVIRLHAFHENGHVRIDVRDDGAGIDRGRVLRKAVALGLVTPAPATQLTDREAVELIFRPGFSTAEVVTNVSGRGVGLDVVKTNIERVGGAVEVESHAGQGTTFSVKIPLTLAIIPALVVTCRGERFAIPQVHLLEVLRLKSALQNEIRRPEAERTDRPLGVRITSEATRQGARTKTYAENTTSSSDAASWPCSRPKPGGHSATRSRRGKAAGAIETVGDAGVYRLRGELLPIVDLSSELSLGKDAVDDAAPDQPAVNLLVLQAEGRLFGLLVDRICDTEEIVVKPLGKRLQALSIYAGATVMGDGKIALILDVINVAQKAGLGQGHVKPGTHGGLPAPQPPPAGREKLLLCRGCRDGLFAVPLRQVARLEELPGSTFGRIGGREVVQYRGKVLPLVSIEEIVTGRGPAVAGGAGAAAREGDVSVVVHRANEGMDSGLIVDAIVDVVEETLCPQPLGARRGVLGSMLVQGRATEILDLEAVSSMAHEPFAPGTSRQAEVEVATHA